MTYPAGWQGPPLRRRETRVLDDDISIRLVHRNSFDHRHVKQGKQVTRGHWGRTITAKMYEERCREIERTGKKRASQIRSRGRSKGPPQPVEKGKRGPSVYCKGSNQTGRKTHAATAEGSSAAVRMQIVMSAKKGRGRQLIAALMGRTRRDILLRHPCHRSASGAAGRRPVG